MRKYAKISLTPGIEISMEILKRLREREEIKMFDIYIGTFTNCREVWYTYMINHKSSTWEHRVKTFCTYEHRNSDKIIINWRDWYISMSWDLPYAWDKYDYLGAAPYQDYDGATDILVREILKLK